MAGFQAPNYTQVPNDFFEMAQDMGEAEIKVMLCIIRETFGYHRDECQLSIRKLAIGAGLTPRNAYNGAEKAITRGLIVKSVSPTNTTTWRAVVARDTARVRKGYSAVSPRKVQVPVKEIKETIKENEDEAALATISKAYTSEIGILTPMIADELREASTAYPVQWTIDAIHEAATQNKRGWKYILAILTRWKAQGNQEQIKPVKADWKQKASEPKAFEAIRQFMQSQEALNGDITDGIQNDSSHERSFPQLECKPIHNPSLL
jgi:DnaD/phage-associated family protein